MCVLWTDVRYCWHCVFHWCVFLLDLHHLNLHAFTAHTHTFNWRLRAGARANHDSTVFLCFTILQSEHQMAFPHSRCPRQLFPSRHVCLHCQHCIKQHHIDARYGDWSPEDRGQVSSMFTVHVNQRSKHSHLSVYISQTESMSNNIQYVFHQTQNKHIVNQPTQLARSLKVGTH